MRRIIKNQLIANVTIGVLLASLLAFVSCGDENEFKGFEVNLEDAEAGVLAYPADGGIKQVKLNSSEDWTAESSAEWCMVSPANGKAGTTCEIRVDSSYVYGPDSRKATITFRSGAITKQVELEQKGYDKIISAASDLEGNPGNIVQNFNFELDIRFHNNLKLSFIG